jgi:hypothetical protein
MPGLRLIDAAHGDADRAHRHTHSHMSIMRLVVLASCGEDRDFASRARAGRLPAPRLADAAGARAQRANQPSSSATDAPLFALPSA